MEHPHAQRDEPTFAAAKGTPPAPLRHRVRAALAPTAAILASALALATLIVLTNWYYVDVPFWDEWLLLPLLKLDAQGQLGWLHLFAPHNEHRPVMSRIVLIALARATHWNMWHECMLNLAFGVVTAVPLWIAAWRDRVVPSAARAILLAVAAVTFLSMNQWENWLWGWQVKVLLTCAGFTWAALLLSSARPRAATVLTAAACGVVATFSFGNGFLVWPALLPVAWMRLRPRPWLALTWLVAAAASIVVFFRGLGQPLEINSAIGTANVPRVLGTMSRLLGSSLAPTAQPWLPMSLGVVGLLAVAALVASARWRREDARRLELVGWTLTILGVGSVALIAIGRQFGDAEVIPARYMAFVNLFWIGLAFVAVPRWPRLAPALLAIPLLATGAGLNAREAYVGRHESLMKWRASLYAPVDNPLVDRFFWAPGYVAPWLLDLRGLSLSLYDCHTQLSRSDWEAAADIIAGHGRAGDVVITSSDWAADCLRGRLAARRSRVEVVPAHESAGVVTAALAHRTSAFLVSGGDAAAADARRLVEASGYPIYRSPVGSMRLFYFPGRIEYVRDRLTPDEVAVDHAAFTGLGDLAQSIDERFMLKGWLRASAAAASGQRTMVTRKAAVYVPVLREAPSTLEIAISRLAPAASARLAIIVNGSQAGAAVVHRSGSSLVFDLSRAGWRYGTNVVELEVGSDSDDLSGLTDDAPVAVFQRIAFAATVPHLQ